MSDDTKCKHEAALLLTDVFPGAAPYAKCHRCKKVFAVVFSRVDPANMNLSPGDLAANVLVVYPFATFEAVEKKE
jgi:hypothetical protein